MDASMTIDPMRDTWDIPPMTWRAAVESSYEEKAKKEDYGSSIDYTVLSVAVLTLGLILLVELARHKIDHMAHGRPFFKTVLEGVNSECKWFLVTILLPFNAVSQSHSRALVCSYTQWQRLASWSLSSFLCKSTTKA